MSERTCIWLTTTLGVAVLVSAILIVYARHESRRQFVLLQELTAERDAIEVEWSKLQIEQSSHSSHTLVEKQARARIGMHMPGATDTEIVQQ